jgi:trehalose synthase
VIKIDDYRAVAPPGAVDIILKLAERVQGRRFLHVSGGRFGGGAAEILRTIVPILTDLGLEAGWEITGGDPGFYATGRALQQALEGTERVLTDQALDHYLEMNRVNAKKLRLDADLVLVHDVQPASLVADRKGEGHWVWRCHFDCSHAQRRAWAFFRPIVRQYDGAVFSLPRFAHRLGVPLYVIHPSIDPLSDKNRELSENEIRATVDRLGIPRDKPILLQASRFDRFKDPVGVIEAYRIAKKQNDCRLVLVGTPVPGEEGQRLLAEMEETAGNDPDVHILRLPESSEIELNALQRAATIVIQKSTREGFGLMVAEAMWKGKPVIGGFAGGITAQLIYEVTGYTVNSVEGCAYRIRTLLNNPELAAKMGKDAREFARWHFLITRNLGDYLALLTTLLR